MDVSLIIELEKELLLPDVRKSIQRMDELLADDFFEFGQSGNAYYKKDVIEMLPGLPEEHFEASEFQSKVLSDGLILLNYKLKRKGNETMQPRSCRSSIWQCNNGQWQMLFHQGTPINSESD